MDSSNLPPVTNQAPPPDGPIPAPVPKKSNTGLIIGIVVLVLCCCCIVVLGLGWQYGDQILQMLQGSGTGSGFIPALASLV